MRIGYGSGAGESLPHNSKEVDGVLAVHLSRHRKSPLGHSVLCGGSYHTRPATWPFLLCPRASVVSISPHRDMAPFGSPACRGEAYED